MDLTNLNVQRQLKPKIEEVLPFYLDAEELETALKFIEHMRNNKMNPRFAGVHSTWNCSFKGKVICYIRLGRKWIGKAKVDKVKWEVSPNLKHLSDYESQITDLSLKNAIWDSFSYCGTCNNGCSPGKNRTFLGKDFTGLCNGMLYSGRLPIGFVNPDEVAFTQIKALLEFEANARKMTVDS